MPQSISGALCAVPLDKKGAKARSWTLKNPVVGTGNPCNILLSLNLLYCVSTNGGCHLEFCFEVNILATAACFIVGDN